MTLLYACLALLVLAVVLIGVFRDILFAALSLAIGSVLLSVVLFQFGASFAAAFELSVCAGLITVLFVSTVSLTKDSDQKAEARLPRVLLLPVAVACAGLAWLAVRWVSTALPPAAPVALDSSVFRETFWGLRATDVLGQLGLILVGVFGILAVLRARAQKGAHHE